MPLVLSCGVPKEDSDAGAQTAQWQPAAGSVVVEAVHQRPGSERRSVLLAANPAIMTTTDCTQTNNCMESKSAENLTAIVYQINRAMKQPTYSETSHPTNCANEMFTEFKVSAKNGSLLILEHRCENNVMHEKRLSNESAQQLVSWAYGR